MSYVSSIISDVLGEKPDGQASVLDFLEGEWGFGVTLFPVQKFILKLYYNIQLDKKEKTIMVYRDIFKEQPKGRITEWEYLELLWSESRTNINPKEYSLTKKRNELVLVIGRGGSKTSLSQFIGGYEFYKLLQHPDPQAYYNLTEMSEIGMQNVAPSENQALDLFSGLCNGFENCAWFTRHMGKVTSEHIRFKSDADIKRFGDSYKGTLKAKIARANAGSVRGGSNIVVIFDELAHFIANDGRHSDKQIYTALTPSTSRFRNDGKKISISSPLNRGGKLWDLYNRSFNEEANFNMIMLQIPTWEINELVDTDFLKGEHADNPRAYICEYGAQFSDSVSSWVDRDKFLFCVKDYMEEKPVGVPGLEYYVGIDLGLKNDGTAISVVHPERMIDPIRPGEYKTVYLLDYAVCYRPGEGKYQHMSPLSMEDMADEVAQIFRSCTPITSIKAGISKRPK